MTEASRCIDERVMGEIKRNNRHKCGGGEEGGMEGEMRGRVGTLRW